MAAVFYTLLAKVFGLSGKGTGVAVGLLSLSVPFLVGGLCGLKRRYCVYIGFPLTPMIMVGPQLVFQSWGMIGVWAAVTLLVGYGYLSQ